jgi:dTDP-4-dehydrorhamnose 3,5-epimerase
VRCVRGAIWDVAVDLRRESPTYRRWDGFMLSDENHRQLFIPAGFAHGFCVMSAEADVTYKLSSYFDSETEAGLRWDDPDIGVEWPVQHPQLSDRDRLAPTLAEIENDLPF